MKERYRQAMEWLYIACIAVSALGSGITLRRFLRV